MPAKLKREKLTTPMGKTVSKEARRIKRELNAESKITQQELKQAQEIADEYIRLEQQGIDKEEQDKSDNKLGEANNKLGEPNNTEQYRQNNTQLAELVNNMTTLQLSALPLLAIGKRPEEVAPLIGCALSTVYGWMAKDPSFREELNRLKAAMYECTVARAISALNGDIDSPSELVRWRAANSILRHHALMELRHSRTTVHLEGVDKLRKVLRDMTSEQPIDAEVVEVQ